jgi:hypothetical protein
VKLSVLVPVYNEAATVTAALKRIFDVDYPCEVEVVVVNDGSVDGTRRCWTRSTTRGPRSSTTSATPARARPSVPPPPCHRRLHDHL